MAGCWIAILSRGQHRLWPFFWSCGRPCRDVQKMVVSISRRKQEGGSHCFLDTAILMLHVMHKDTIKGRILIGSTKGNSKMYQPSGIWWGLVISTSPRGVTCRASPFFSQLCCWIISLWDRDNSVLMAEEALSWWAKWPTSDDDYLWVLCYKFWILSSVQLTCCSAEKPWAKAMEVRENKTARRQKVINCFSHSVLWSNSHLDLQHGGWWLMVLLPTII